jgi:hypothetical protein
MTLHRFILQPGSTAFPADSMPKKAAPQKMKSLQVKCNKMCSAGVLR